MSLPGRVTVDEVRSLIDIDPDIDVEQHINVANELVTEICEPVVTYTAERLKLIEKLMACHFCTEQDARANSERIGPLKVDYDSKIDLGFDGTRYGQDAMRLDTNGGLARLNNSMKTIKGLGNLKTKVIWGGTSCP